MKMTGRSWIGVAAISAVLIVSIAWFCSYEPNLSAMRGDYGYLDRGAKFDVEIGSDISNVERKLVRHSFQLYKKKGAGSTCLRHEYDKSKRIDVYSDESWRSATLCVVYSVRDGRVSALEWSYEPFVIAL